MNSSQNINDMPPEKGEFHEIFKEYYPRLCYFASNILQQNTEVDDVVQDAFIKLWQRSEKITAAESIQSFLYTVVKNNCLNLLKHHNVVKRHVHNSEGENHLELDAISKLIEAQTLHMVNSAVNSLPEGCRKVIHLSYFEKMRSQDIASELKVSINTVKTQKRRALQLLRELVTRE